MKLLFLLLLCLLILARSMGSPSFDDSGFTACRAFQLQVLLNIESTRKLAARSLLSDEFQCKFQFVF